MRIDNQLYQIAAANYGLQLKDPILVAFDVLSQNPKFELIDNIVENDHEDFYNVLNNYYTNNKTCKTLRNILEMFMIINGRKGFYARHRQEGHQRYDESNVSKWVDMLAKELLNSGTGNINDGVYKRGSGVVNGSKIRAAIYYLLDILQFDSVTNVSPVVTVNTPFCLIGRDITTIQAKGVTNGLGEYMEIYEAPTLEHPGHTVSGYWFYLILTDIFTGNVIKVPIFIGDNPLYEEDYAQVGYPLYAKIDIPYGLYEVKIANNEDSTEYISTELILTYNAIKEKYIPDINDYIYEKFGSSDALTRTIFYKGLSSKVIMPTDFDGSTLTELSPTTFCGTSVENVVIPDGVTSIG
jgi:hypothetical protein